MTWVKPQHSRDEVIRAGESIKSRVRRLGGPEWNVLVNWRAAHAFPLNSTAVTLSTRAHRADQTVVLARRLKRYSSIRTKLRLIPRINLYEMQDIAGVRAIMRDSAAVDALAQSYSPEVRQHGGFLSSIVRVRDYVQAPKPDGYRSVHVVLQYRGRVRGWDGLFVEAQIRSRKQHAWATTVETLETVLKQRLRTFQGEPTWKRFLTLMSAAIAIDEGKPPVPGTPASLDQIREEVQAIDHQVGAYRTLEGLIGAINSTPKVGAGRGYFLLDMRPGKSETKITTFQTANIGDAVRRYAEVERDIASEQASDPGANAVLVSVQSIQNLREAYPNYYLDASAFLELYRRLILGPP
jgi:ppGpp synthetase/RelA/SpoT-type nucleotidyltranferase